MLKYAKVLQLIKRADYKEIFTHDFYDNLWKDFSKSDNPDLQRGKHYYKGLDAFFKKILAGKHGKGYLGYGKKQKDLVKDLAVQIYKYSPGVGQTHTQALKYQQWKKQILQALKNKDINSLTTLTDPDGYYVQTSGKNLQYDYEPGLLAESAPQAALKQLYKNYLTSDILKQLNRDQKLVDKKIRLRKLWNKAYEMQQSKIRKEKLRGKKADQAWIRWEKEFRQTPQMKQLDRVENKLYQLYPRY